MKNFAETSFSTEQIKSIDPTATHTVKQLYTALFSKKGNLTTVEHYWLDGIEKIFMDKDEVDEATVQILMGEIYQIIQGRPTWNDEEKELHRTIRQCFSGNHEMDIAEDYFEQIDDVCTSMTRHQFNKRLPVADISGNYKNFFNYVALCFNMVNEELERTVVSKMMMDAIVNYFKGTAIVGTRPDNTIACVSQNISVLASKSVEQLQNSSIDTIFQYDAPALKQVLIENNKAINVPMQFMDGSAVIVNVIVLKNHFEEIEGYVYIIDTNKKERANNNPIKAEDNAFELARFSHDLLAPLSSMNMSLESMKTLLQKTLNDIEDAEKTQSYMVNKTKEALTIGRSNREGLSVQAIDLKTVINTEIADILQFTEDKDAVDFTLNLHHTGRFCTDARKLSSILHNLVTNAIKYKKPEEKALIEISSEDHQTGILLHVKDNGIGIDADHQSLIFNKGYRVPGNDNTIGHGIGLHAVDIYVKKLYGNISLSSIAGEGSTFSIYLPSL